MSNIESLVFYLGLFSLSAIILAFGIKRNFKPIIGLALAIPIAIGSFRYGMGTDYFNYISGFTAQAKIPFTDYFANIAQATEPAFYLLTKLSQIVTGDARLLFGVSSLLTILFFYLGLRRFNLRHTALIYFLYLTTVFPMTLNVVRQGIAISIIFFATSFIIQKKPTKYILAVLLASLFHISALVLLPLYLISRLIKPNQSGTYAQTIIKIMGVSIVIVPFLPYIFTIIQQLPLFAKYIVYQSQNVELGNNYIFYVKVLLLGFALILYKPLLSKNKYNIYFLALLTLEIVFSVLGFTSAFTKRIALYFSPFSLMLLAGMIEVFMDSFGRRLTFWLVVLYGILFFVISYFILRQADIFPYVFLGGVQ